MPRTSVSTDLRDSINKRFEDLRDWLKSEVKRLEERFDHVDDRLDPLEHRYAWP